MYDHAHTKMHILERNTIKARTNKQKKMVVTEANTRKVEYSDKLSANPSSVGTREEQ